MERDAWSPCLSVDAEHVSTGRSRRNRMAEKVKVWFDPEADYLEVQFREALGFMRATAHDAVMERVDEQGHVLA